MPRNAASSANEGFLARCGRVRGLGERSFWIIGRKQQDFESAGDLVEGLMAKYQRLDIVFSAPELTVRQWLRSRFPKALVLPPPLASRYVANRFLINLNVRALMFVGDLAPGDRFILRAANRRAAPAAIVQATVPDITSQARAVPAASALGAVAERLEHHFVTTSAAQDCLVEAGIPIERISRLESAPLARSATFMTVIAHLLTQDLKLIRSRERPIRRRLESLALWCMAQPRLRQLLAARVERIGSVAELRKTLGNPQVLLCLGNGPSSEAPEVADVKHDCLFRVNHVWLSRGFLTGPDMVFTGAKVTLSLVKGPIFGLQSVKSEARLLVTRLLRPRFRRVRYATIERFGLYLSESRWQGIRPTNGAAMLATAVALQPPRLVISGIDLFSHPAGTYPGDTATPNAYSPGHEAESELALLLEALSRYEGELTILSPALKARWDEHRATRSRQASI
ncbi:hypothetical protein HBA54_23215 [Pelagibius litoralis]|uniref:Uncharacterized protein n=1 Tax=Pelagibius litoralis TaxID=374515 RepID=A0A967KFR3_9PROT|nr:hypothetical protein [Pelagibius litoralis]NIA71505.1 hypothetical protein [Pelagibius litoralis]